MILSIFNLTGHIISANKFTSKLFDKTIHFQTKLIWHLSINFDFGNVAIIDQVNRSAAFLMMMSLSRPSINLKRIYWWLKIDLVNMAKGGWGPHFFKYCGDARMIKFHRVSIPHLPTLPLFISYAWQNATLFLVFLVQCFTFF